MLSHKQEVNLNINMDMDILKISDKFFLLFINIKILFLSLLNKL